MLEKIRVFCKREGLLTPGSRVVVGVSGGADSVCLLRVLCLLGRELGLGIEAVHVHHGIRAQEAEDDLAYVEELCRRWDVPLSVFRVDVPMLAKAQHLSLEEAGRNARYQIFEQVRVKRGCDVIAVAHHMDDLAETVLMNMARGSGIRGAAGTRAVRDAVVRPLLCVRRKEIEAWLTAEGISWRTDSTNQDEIYFRNRVRKRLIPELESCGNERAVEHVAELAADLQDADAYFCGEAKRLLEESRQQMTGQDDVRSEIYKKLMPPAVWIPCRLLQKQPRILGAYLVRQGLAELNAGLRDISRTHIEQVLALAQMSGGKETMLPGNIRARLEYDRIVLERTVWTEENPEFTVTFRIFLADSVKKVPQNCCINWFDYDKIDRNIQLRCRRSKDRICVKAGGSYKKLKDYLIDARMPARVRDRWPVLAMGERILWIPGYRMDEDVKVGQETKMILEARIGF